MNLEMNHLLDRGKNSITLKAKMYLKIKNTVYGSVYAKVNLRSIEN